MKLLIIADDFTGALDTGVQFAKSGASTKVIVGTEVDFSCVEETVLVADTETRHLSKEEAYDIVYELSSKAEKAGVQYIYKKTDSALRGNIGAELGALVAASGQKILPFVPAFPQMNRITKGGIHYIDGVPVTESPFGIDPFEPVKNSAVTDIIAEQSEILTCSISQADDWKADKSSEEIVVFDAISSDDLESIGRKIADNECLHIMAGCAGFGEILPKLLNIASDREADIPKLDSRFLVICGSVNPITVAQVAEAEKNGFSHIHLTPRQKLKADYWQSDEGKAEFDNICRVIKENPLCIIDSNDEGGNELTRAYALSQGLGIEDIRQGISKTIGYIVGELFTNPDVGTLFITGGDTLLECMKCVGVNELEPLCEMRKGVVLSKFTYKECSRYVISKSGGFGEKTLLVDLAKEIK